MPVCIFAGEFHVRTNASGAINHKVASFKVSRRIFSRFYRRSRSCGLWASWEQRGSCVFAQITRHVNTFWRGSLNAFLPLSRRDKNFKLCIRFQGRAFLYEENRRKEGDLKGAACFIWRTFRKLYAGGREKLLWKTHSFGERVVLDKKKSPVNTQTFPQTPLTMKIVENAPIYI